MQNLIRFFSLFVLIAVFSIRVNAQVPDFNWAKYFGSTGLDIGHSIVVDLLGNTYLTGEFTGTVNFGGISLTSAGNVDFFLVKLDTIGNTIWAKRGGGTLTDRGYGITLDHMGYLYVTGHYFGAADFSDTTLTSSGNLDNFVAKYDTSGNLIWIRDGKSVSQVSSRDITLDPSGNIFVAGYFGSATVDSVNFDGVKITTNGGRDIFLAKYNNDGVIQWAVSAGSSLSGEEGRSLAVDLDGNPVMVCVFADTANFSGTQLISYGGNDIGIVKYNTASGALIWAKNAGGTGGDAPDAVSIDVLGNIYLTGYFDSTATFGTTQITGIDGDEVFIAKYNNSGDLIWVKSAGGSLLDRGNDLMVTPDGYSYITGRFNGTATFGTTNITSAGDNDIFIAKYDPAGELEWVKSAGGTLADYGNAITVDIVGNCYVSGYFRGTAVFGTFNFTSAGAQDIFVTKIGNAIIPVELVSFKADLINDDVYLAWITATELNNSGFEIQRSADKINFNKIGFIEGKGTTTETQTYLFIDKGLSHGSFHYRLKQIDFDGTSQYSQIVSVDVGAPIVFEVLQNYPNPFNPETMISFNLPVTSDINVTVYNLLGQIVDVVADARFDAGKHNIVFNGAALTSGVYFYEVNAKGIDGSLSNSVKKMMLLK